ncbi:transglycosylase domain-containing protein, partial [Serratia marcescens]|uniref:transglycosylase domain-containing protein n=1 Tax=Serratia marcescens TaxID=615 RepID=UPI003879D719
MAVCCDSVDAPRMRVGRFSLWLSGDFGYVAHSDWVSMDDISPQMALAVMAAEDQKFPDHWGF